MTIPIEERGIAHRRDTGEMGVGRDGRVIDLHVLTGREGLVITLVGLVITPSHSHRLSLGMPASLTNLGLLAAMARTNGTLGRDWQPAGQHAGEFVCVEKG